MVSMIENVRVKVSDRREKMSKRIRNRSQESFPDRIRYSEVTGVPVLNRIALVSSRKSIQCTSSSLYSFLRLHVNTLPCPASE